MQNPASVADAAGEWIEITNISNNNISLNGLIIRDDGGEEHIISDENLVVIPGHFIIMGVNDNPTENGGVSVDYVYNGLTLSNLWDEVILEHPSGVILDEVHYDNGATFPDEEGASMMLLAPTLNNSLGENWAVADIVFSSGDFGTPGEANYSSNCGSGDINADGILNVLDLVALVNCILNANCDYCIGDMNADYNFNILDIVALVNCILLGNCGT